MQQLGEAPPASLHGRQVGSLPALAYSTCGTVLRISTSLPGRLAMASQDCQVCLERYDEDERRPRCLSCGHTLCTSCVADTIARGPLDCPFCRIVHSTPVLRAEDVPVNFTVVSLLQDTSLSLVSQSPEALLDGVKKETNDRTINQLVTCNCNLARLKDFQQRLSAQTKVQERHIQALRSLLARHEDHLRDLTDVSSQVREAVGEGEGWKRALELSQTRVRAAATLLEVTAIHHEDGVLEASVQGWAEKVQQLLKSQVVQAAEEVESLTRVALEAVVERNMTTVASAVTPTKCHVSPVTESLSVERSLVADESNKSHVLSEVLRKAEVVGSEVWAVLEELDGRPRCAKITQMDGRMYLHALVEGTPPLYTHTVPYEDVRNMVDETCVRTFLDLSWAGAFQGRVTIRLTNATSRCLHFFLLCTGERGPSYANTLLLDAEARGQAGERLWGGDYQNNDGSGGAALQGLTRGELSSQSVTAGLVAGFCYSREDSRPAHFVVYTNDCPILYEESPIGQVVAGLDVVKDAVKVPNIREVLVSDCGIVLSC